MVKVPMRYSVDRLGGGMVVIRDTRDKRQHARLNYDGRELDALCYWLNERELGYPVPANLAPLTRGQTNEHTHNTECQHPIRAGSSPKSLHLKVRPSQ